MSLPSSNTLDNLGGQLSDYQPVVDPTTDRPMSCENEAYADVAAMTRMATRAWCKFAAPTTVGAHDATWGNDDSNKPTVTNPATGKYTVTWPASVLDALAVTRSINFRAAWACCEAKGFDASAQRTGPNTVDVFITRRSDGTDQAPTGNVNVFAF